MKTPQTVSLLVGGCLLVLVVALALIAQGQGFLSDLLTNAEAPLRGSIVMDHGEPFAELFPAPDAILWHKGDEIPLWLSTNLHAVDLRISSIGMGIGEIDVRNPAGEAVPLGTGLGCLSNVVSGLELTDTATVAITLDRLIANQLLTVNYRFYRDGTSPPDTSLQVAFSTPSTTVTLSGLDAGATYRVDASRDASFPTAITRTITFVAGDASSSTPDDREEEVHLRAETGATMIACEVTQDIVLSLHDGTGAELGRYVVDILPSVTTPTPTPTPTPAPRVPEQSELVLYRCVADSADDPTAPTASLAYFVAQDLSDWSTVVPTTCGAGESLWVVVLDVH